jgi:hypothetical protein
MTKKFLAIVFVFGSQMALSNMVGAQVTSSLRVDSGGNVGVGTATPTAALHVQKDSDAQLLVKNTTSTADARIMLSLENEGAVQLDMTNGNKKWRIVNLGSTLRISKVGTGMGEFELSDSGDLAITGALTENSSRLSKRDIEAVDPQTVLAKVLELPIMEWSYKSNDRVRHLGPMAEDFWEAFGLGKNNRGIAAIDTSGIALAAIQGLNHNLKQKDVEIASLRRDKDALQIELATLKKLVYELVSKDKVAVQELK